MNTVACIILNAYFCVSQYISYVMLPERHGVGHSNTRNRRKNMVK